MNRNQSLSSNQARNKRLLGNSCNSTCARLTMFAYVGSCTILQPTPSVKAILWCSYTLMHTVTLASIVITMTKITRFVQMRSNPAQLEQKNCVHPPKFTFGWINACAFLKFCPQCFQQDANLIPIPILKKTTSNVKSKNALSHRTTQRYTPQTVATF